MAKVDIIDISLLLFKLSLRNKKTRVKVVDTLGTLSKNQVILIYYVLSLVPSVARIFIHAAHNASKNRNEHSKLNLFENILQMNH